MALPILDGNQTAATLSTVLTGGEHIPAHTVVSLGSQAITDVRSAVSGSVVSISNFPASQSTTFGAVTGSVSVLNFPSTQTIAGTVTANVNLISDQAGGNSPVVFGVSGADVNTIRTVIYSSANSSFGNDQGAPVDSENPLPISGTVTANTGDVSSLIGGGYSNLVELFGNENIGIKEPSFTTQIAGTVTANVQFSADLSNVNVPAPSQGIALGYLTDSETFFTPVHEDQGLPVRIQGQSATQPISGTVTANNPSGALTTRFGSVTTANTAQITSAVTNTSRKYLLAQNISAGTVTIGIGFSPTTTQGVQLPAGGGLTFDAFCPTGAVYWLGAVTGAAFTILEG